ncbi:MarR family transcriptional regulator [uncultured Roseobacter sp.]|uniref:MarR family winged helix-turn-helix transcriptional regulator n=1 Tax=uncultured Roseobacter sp. TaxID=114847 RepID=UPI002622DFE4|nr:MarR family transcriptional regulator [uncultured Roseobacter sp.]
MAAEKRTREGEAVTALILEVFRLNGRLLLAGDRLVSDLGLTSARWQILGAIAYAEQPESVAWHARSLGVHRQGVQRIVNEMRKEGIVDFQPNPQHKRAHLVVLTAQGQKLYEAAIARQNPWVNDLSQGLSAAEIAAAHKVIGLLRARLQQASAQQEENPGQG